MVTVILSRAIIVVAGILYPAYCSFKAVRMRSHREYTQWMMYWIVFAMFQTGEVLTDTFVAWLPFYYEMKILIVLWLVLPFSQGSKQLYRIVVHPFLLRHETMIDDTLQHLWGKMMKAFRRISQQVLNMAATTVVLSAIKGQAAITETLLRNQGQQEQLDGGEAAQRTEDDGRRQRPSSSSDSHFSEGFEIIEEPPEAELYEDPPEQLPPSSPTYRPSDQNLDSNGLYHRT